MSKDKMLLFVLIGITLMASAVPIFVLGDGPRSIIGSIVLFFIGLGCAIAGTDTNDKEEIG